MFPGLGLAQLERAEIYFLDGARSMVERGDSLVPYYRGEPFFDKPALTYWLIAGCFRLFGFTSEAARLVPAVASLGAVLATVWLGVLLLDRRSALLGGLVLATTLAFLSFGRIAMSDMPMTLWSTLAVGLAVANYRPSAPAWLLPALGLALGLGFLTKGPIALLLPGLAVLVLLWSHRQEELPVTVRRLVLAVALFAIAGCGWFAAIYWRLGAGPLEYFFLRENLQRFAGETYDSGRPPWYYLAAYLVEGLPWSLFFPAALLRFAARDRADPGLRLLLGWLALMIVPLSLSRGKIDYYLLPLYPAAALVIGRYLSSPWGRLERAWGRAALVLVAAGLAVATQLPARIPLPWIPGPQLFLGITVAAGVMVVALLATAVRISPGALVVALAAAASLGFTTVTRILIPTFIAAQPNQAMLEDVARERHYRPDAQLAVCEDPTRVARDLLFYARLPVQERCDLWNPASSRVPYLLLLDPRERAALGSIPGMRTVAEYRHLSTQGLTLRGLLEATEDRLSLLANFETDDPVADRRRRKEMRKEIKARREQRLGAGHE